MSFGHGGLRRRNRAYSGPNVLPHRRIVSYETTIPRSCSISSTKRTLRGNLKYNQTVWAMSMVESDGVYT